MQQRALLMQIEQLKKQLQELETAVEGEEVPVTALEGLKEAVDNVRTTLWATMSTKADPFEIGSAMAELRIKRTTEMCRRIVLDIDAQEITAGTRRCWGRTGCATSPWRNTLSPIGFGC